ncbi:DUF6611 family protein, partial [Rathayibacter sp. AY1B1]
MRYSRDEHTSPAVAELAAIAAVLRRADRLLDTGALTPLEHEEV